MILSIRSQLFSVILAISWKPALLAICAEGQSSRFTSEDGKTAAIASSARLIGIPIDGCRRYCEGNQLRDNSELACFGFAYKWTTKTCQLYTDPSLAVSLVDGVNSVIYRKECADPDTEIVTGPGPPGVLAYEVFSTTPTISLTGSILSTITTKTPASVFDVSSTKYTPSTASLIGQIISNSSLTASALMINQSTTVKLTTTKPATPVTTAKLTPTTTLSASNGLKLTVYPTGSFTLTVHANDTTVATGTTVKSPETIPTVKPAQATYQLPASITPTRSSLTTTAATPTKAATFAPAASTAASTVAPTTVTPAVVSSDVTSQAVAIATVTLATAPPATIAPSTVKSATIPSLPVASVPLTHAQPAIPSSAIAPATAVLATSKPAPVTPTAVVTPPTVSLTAAAIVPTLPPFSPATMSSKPNEPSILPALSPAISFSSVNNPSLTLNSSVEGDRIGLLVDPRLMVPITAELPKGFLPEEASGGGNSGVGGLQFPPFLRWPNYDPRWVGEVLRGGGFDTCRLSESFMECWRRERQKQIEERRKQKHQENVQLSKKKQVSVRPRGHSTYRH